ncbi:uncharacterized protein LOC129739271 [Uranotaenia lowii]|uniref:uncharacterized protein LOC129739271 n=1 Tax=Uranotaenia lowii TaxID=190385 RepID=UPI0024786DF9|nr:uncharacterized protein LOC129739271 [Uranotaenia lowii]
MVKTRMISKNCPNCEGQIAIASKRCTACGHSFTGREPGKSGRPKGSGKKSGRPSAAEQKRAAAIAASAQIQRRRTGRVRREKPNYYDSLQFEKKKKKTKPTRSALFKGKEAKQTQLIAVKETVAARANRHAQRKARKEEIDGGGDLAAKLPLEKQEIAALILSEINRKLGSVVWKQP